MLRPRKRPGPSAALLLAGLALLAGCRAAGGDRGASGPVVIATGAGGPADADAAAREMLFQALRSALAEGEDELAGQLVARLRAGALDARELDLVEGAERVLVGRALVRGLELALESEPLASAEGEFRLVLVARSDAAEELRLRLPPCDLKRLRASMDVRGVEGLDYESRVTPALRELVLPPAVETRVELCTYELPLGRALAVRERWRLETRSGEIDRAGEAYPAAGVRVTGSERERLAPELGSDPAASTAFAERLGGGTPPSVRELLELALRTPKDARADALHAAAPVVARLAQAEPERIRRAEPALRWLTQNRDLGLDAAAWARYLAWRSEADAEPEPSPDGLDLPARPRLREAQLR